MPVLKRGPNNAWLRGTLALVSVGLAAVLQNWTWTTLRVQLPYPFFFLAVMVSAWFGGAAAALVAIVAGAVASQLLFALPAGEPFFVPALRVALYLAVSCTAAYCILAMKSARDRAAASARAAEESLRELRREQDRAAATLGRISDGVIRIDKRGRITYLNQIAGSLIGAEPETVIGRPAGEVLNLSDAVTREPVILQSGAGSEPSRRLELLQAGGSRVPVEVSRTPVAGADGDGLITLRDMRDRRRAEGLQAESEQRFRVLADSAPVLIWMATPDMKCDYFNRPWLEFTGRTLEQELGWGWAEGVHPDDLNRYAAVLNEAFEARRSFRSEYRLRRADGQYGWVFGSGVPRFAPGGEFLGFIGSCIDVTDRKETEERYRIIVETANEGVWMITREARTVYCNQRMASILGCTIEELVSADVTHFCFPEDVDDARKHIRANLDGHAESFDFRFRRADGQEVVVLACTSPVRDAEGEVTAALGMFSDVTERRRAMAALRESEERFRQLAENVEDVFWIRDLPEERFVYVSPAYERLWGRSRKALLENPREWMAAIHPDDRARVEAALARQMAGGASDEEYRIVQPGGRIRWVRDRCFPVSDASGTVYRAIGIAENTTDRKNAEMAVRESEAKLRALLESASQGVVAVDESGRILLVNAKTEEMFGYTRDELLGKPIELLLPDALREVHKRHRAAYFAHPRTRPMGVGLYLAGRKKSGEDFPLEISLSFLDEGGARTALALITDITERKRFEEQLRETAKLESLGVLAGGIAHDFNNILTGIMGNASLAMETLDDPDQVRRLLEFVVRSSERAAHLTHQMLAYSGKGRFIVRPVNLSTLLRDIVDLLQSSISRTVQLEMDLTEDLPLVEADVAQIQQLTMNLVLNAAEAIGERPGKLTVRTAPCRVTADSGSGGNMAGADLPPGEYVCLEVRDTGCGMDETTRSRMFDPFFTTKFTGRGLGLAAALGIVRGHGGTIQVDTAPGRGTVMTVLFPASAAEAIVEEGRPGPREVVPRGTVLVVDDEAVVRTTASNALRRAGFRVLLAENGQAAVRLFAETPGIDVVLLDMTMPVMSGEETLLRLREINPEVEVILSSGYSEVEALRRFQGQAIAGFAQKPYTAARLVEQVGGVMAGRLAARTPNAT